MHFEISSTTTIKGLRQAGAAFVAILTLIPGAAIAEIIWDGNFNNHSFENYHTSSDPEVVQFHLIPAYGRPPQYGNQSMPIHVGNGELLSLVDFPTRGSKYAAKFTVKNSGNGAEPADCDPAVDCGTRRANLQMTSTFLNYYNAIPQGAERWVSISFFVPKDYDGSGNGFGPVLWGSKSSTQNKPGAFGIWAENNEWQIIHRYYSREMHKDRVDARESWWVTFEYSSKFPSSTNWAQGLVDFPDVKASRAALANLNKGGWTDFVWHFKTDIDEFEDNTGFLDVYMRAGSGSWVHVLKIRPMKNLARNPEWLTKARERVYDRGVGQYGPGGYTSQMGLYMDKGRVWKHDRNIVIYMDNHKVGDADATFTDMSHDGSSPGNPGKVVEAPPNAPVIVQND